MKTPTKPPTPKDLTHLADETAGLAEDLAYHLTGLLCAGGAVLLPDALARRAGEVLRRVQAELSALSDALEAAGPQPEQHQRAEPAATH